MPSGPATTPSWRGPMTAAWHPYDMSTSEFLRRVLTDVDFQPFGVAGYALNPTFEPGCGNNE